MINRGNELKLQLANPGILERYIKTLSPWFCGTFISSLIIGLWFAIFNSPPDYLQGETVRIMYVHVPSAWMALFIYSSMAVASLIGSIYGHLVAFIYAKSVAPIGALFTLICLVTGSLWGKPMWGTWWVWDARLTSMFILLLFYLAYVLTWKFIEIFEKANKISSIIGIVGLINLPVIKYSVDWWNTLHQTSSITLTSAPTIHYTMLVPLIIMLVGMIIYSLVVFLMKYKTEVMKFKLGKKKNYK
jgi:heme exporter protein C